MDLAATTLLTTLNDMVVGRPVSPPPEKSNNGPSDPTTLSSEIVSTAHSILVASLSGR
jgi:hypothetical protein